MMDQKQLRRYGLFDAKAPRYTSYPPATKFSDAVAQNTFLDWVSAIKPGSRISLYMHVPFCKRLCWFCACRTQGVRSEEPVRAYVNTLLTEIAMLKAALPQGVKLQRLHWGGGTPTLLAPDLILKLNEALRGAVDFADDYEFSVEIDPNEIDKPRMQALARSGMNRASIGVQDFDPAIQEIIGRIQTYETTEAAVKGLREVGVHSLNADILFGLPTQTKTRLSNSVQQLLSLSPDRVALYGYAHVPWMARRQGLIPTDLLPTPEERVDLFDTARRLFTWDGYESIGTDHFARPEDSMAKAARTGHLRRNFQGYTDDTCDVLIGLGASSISRFPQGFAQNASGTATYQKAIRAGEFSAARGHAFTADDHIRSRMIEALMCDFHINRAEIDTLSGDDTLFDRYCAPALEKFKGVVTMDEDGFAIKTEGKPLCRMIARMFDAYDIEAGSHSQAF